MKFAPEIRFRIDERFEEAERISEVAAHARACSATSIRTTIRSDVIATCLNNKHKAPAGPKPKREKRDVHGWVVLDKPIGMTSTHAVAVVRRLFAAKRAGHAGTLDPLASGLLPIALGEATKTVPFVMDGRKSYASRCAGARSATPTTPRVAWSRPPTARPSPAAIAALLPHYTGTIEQVPPCYSAIKIEGERAYDIAREGEERRDRAAAGRNP